MIGRLRKKTRLATAALVALAIGLELGGSVRGQSFETLRTSSPNLLPNWLQPVDPAFQSTPSQRIASRNRSQPPTAATTAPPSSIPDTDSSGGPSLPAALPLPATDPSPDPATAKPFLPVDKSLIPGRTIEPIDLPAALRLAGVRDLDIAIARQQLAQAVADLQKGRRTLATQSVPRSDLVSSRWANPDTHGASPECEPKLIVHRGHGRDGQRLCRRLSGNGLSAC